MHKIKTGYYPELCELCSKQAGDCFSSYFSNAKNVCLVLYV